MTAETQQRSSPAVPITFASVTRAALTPLRKYGQFRGRASRLEFWSYTIVVNALQVVIGLTAPLLVGLLSLVLFIPSLAVLVRRLHDVNRSGWWVVPMPLLAFALFMLFAMTQVMLGDEAGQQIFIGLGVALPLTLVLGLVLLVWTCRPGTSGANRYDVAPQLEPKGTNSSEP